MSNHESIRKLWVVMRHFVAFAFLLVIPSTAILIGNNSYFGTTNLVASDLMEADNSWKVATSILT